MIPYILHVALLISICLLFYKIFLQRETFYHLNRVVLLICLGLSFALPLITIPEAWTLRTAPEQVAAQAHETVTPGLDAQIKAQILQQQQQLVQQQAKQQVIAKTKQQPAKQAPVVQEPAKVQPVAVAPVGTPATPIWPIVFKWMFYLYWAGVAAFGLNLLLQVVVLLIRSYSNPVIKDGKFRIIEVTGDKAPCSFGNNIFINPEKYDWDTYNQILMHEKVHIQQGHSLDILLAELVLVFQWFNPFAWLYRGELENNLEFLTDEAVLGHNPVEKESYQMSLLKVSVPHLALSVTTNYNQSLLKKRIVMMNAKKSNIHTMWKYFILVPIMGALACGLNQVAFSQSAQTKSKAVHTKSSQHNNWGDQDRTQGSWFATIKGEKVRMEFRSNDDDHNWSDNDSFLLSEFSNLPKDTKGDFTIKRDAGTILFTGKFEGDEGFGHYKFTADKDFTNYLRNAGIDEVEDNDDFTFFVLNMKRGYVEMLKANGYGHLSKNDLISMVALKVDEPYIKFWKEMGYEHLSSNELVSGKALGVTREYVDEIRKAGYTHLDFNQLISFKAQGIDGKYIASLKKANLNTGNSEKPEQPERPEALPRAEDLSSFKAMNIDSTYIRGLRNAGYNNIPMSELTSMKAVGVTPEYIKQLSDIGYKNLSANELTSFKSLGVTPEYVKTITGMGYPNLSANEIESFKAQGITPEYVRSVAEMGYKDLSANELSSFKALGVTGEFIKSFNDIGYKNIPVNDLTSLKALGIRPSFVKGFEEMGYKNISLNQLSSLKALNINADYIRSFEAVGYKQLPINELSSLKSLGVTPAFIQGFKDLGYTVSPNEATSLKATGVTPAYVKDMKAKGFVSKDLNKYINLKSAFN
ncbi:MAG: M56 family metallopeptidase [Sphingobacteriales bacterium]